MEALFFNVSTFIRITTESSQLSWLQVSSGFLEGVLRGYKAGLLTQSHYANLTQCESLEGTQVFHPTTQLTRAVYRLQDAARCHRLWELPRKRAPSHLHLDHRRESHTGSG